MPRRAVNPIALAALVGVLIGFGLGLGANVSGAVLALYGLIIAAMLAALVLLARRGRR